MDFTQFLIQNLGRITFSLIILAASLLVRTVIKKTVNTAFNKVSGKLGKKQQARTKTIRSILVNIINLIILLIAVLTVLSTWGIDIAPVLAGLGVFGIALSFGSQSLVKDFISGFFIILEDQYHVGDTIKIGTHEGVVKKMTIRSTMIKDEDGNKIFIPNSKIDIVTKVKPKTSTKKSKSEK